jgi:hypothetical protein
MRAVSRWQRPVSPAILRLTRNMERMRRELHRTYDDDRHAPAPRVATTLPFRVLCVWFARPVSCSRKLSMMATTTPTSGRKAFWNSCSVRGVPC